MPLLQINAGPDGPVVNRTQRPLGPTLQKALQTPGPIIIMLHGYKFAPGHHRGCPHRHILSLRPNPQCWKALSWPRALGFGAGKAQEGLGIAFGWSARGTIWQAYARAASAAGQLARLITQIRRAAPGRAVHLMAHSLGARVALGAMRQLPGGSIDRVILLNAAEYGAYARDALESEAGRAAEVINVTSRENDLFDFLLERLIAPPEPGDRTMAHAMPQRPNTLTIQLDHPGTLDVLTRAGFAIAPRTFRFCHWSTYLRPGLFDVYRTLLRNPETLPLAQLRAALPETPEPRWSRVLPVPDLRLALPTGQRAAS
ncbi:MAG: alpha/beta hydrolase [Rhodobacteraceae bacterium]|nr:alpha/beta hydrolase [Paracoccaceae bacterium]